MRHGIGIGAAVGAAVGLAFGVAATFPQHDFLFSLPGTLHEDAGDVLLRTLAGVGLPITRDAAVCAVAVAAGALLGALGGAFLTLLGVRGRRLLDPATLGALAGLAGAAALAALWRRRGVQGGGPPILWMTLGLVVWTAAVAAAIHGVGRALAAVPRRVVGVGVVAGVALAVVWLRVPPPSQAPGVITATAPPRPLLLLGLDAASWANLEAGLASGSLPHLAALRARGAWGELQSIEPTWSPIVWTSIVTGRRPDDHGILYFTLDGVPYSSNSRTAWALWEILPRFGQRSAFHYWWASWPAEAVDGRVVSDRYLQAALPDRVHPAGDLALVDAVAREARARAPKPAVLLGPEPDTLRDPGGDPQAARLNLLRRFLERDEIVTALGVAAIRDGGYPLVGVYLRGMDAIGHEFSRWDYHETSPRLARWLYGEPGPDQSRFGPVVRRTSEVTDAWVGRLVEATAGEWNVVIVSDHGMSASVPRELPTGPTPQGNHHRSGLLLMAGPDVRPGTRVRGAGIYDVFPTVLHLLGLPVPDGLPGRVLVEALGDSRRDAPVLRVAGFGERPVRDTAPIATGEDADFREGLRALGYVVD